jgi:hypothetical protein
VIVFSILFSNPKLERSGDAEIAQIWILAAVDTEGKEALDHVSFPLVNCLYQVDLSA